MFCVLVICVYILFCLFFWLLIVVYFCLLVVVVNWFLVVDGDNNGYVVFIVGMLCCLKFKCVGIVFNDNGFKLFVLLVLGLLGLLGLIGLMIKFLVIVNIGVGWKVVLWYCCLFG